jgi:hypothetical protein
VIREWVGLAALNVVFLGVGTSLLASLGLVRERGEAIRYSGLSLVTGWAAVGIASSYALVLGVGLSLLQIISLASVLAACGLLVSRRVPPLDRRPRRFADRGLERVAALIGALVLAGYLEVLFLRARLAEPE